MKIYNIASTENIHSELVNLFKKYKEIKNFKPDLYIEIKASLLNSYMSKFGLKSCVIAVSGGIDSALVLSLVSYASKLKDSPIKKIVAVSLPVSNSIGATGQAEATNRATELCNSLNITQYTIELENAHKTIETLVSKSLNIESKEWALGQLVAHTRTPTLYYCATLLTQENLPSIIIGTTNRDEGLYLGYFGKASDGLVDVQLISDLHKSEVYSVSKFLNVPKSIIEVSPQGDMYDGRIDEDVFGASYDFVEYYLYFLSLDESIKQSVLNSLSPESLNQFKFFSKNLENLHTYNKHKYYSASPAVHLDLNSLIIPESWKTNCLIGKPIEEKIIKENFIGLFELDNLPQSFLNNNNDIKRNEHFVNENKILHLENVLNSQECKWLLEQTESQEWIPANLYGKVKDFNSKSETIMSHRLSVYNKVLAYSIFNRIAPFIDKIKVFNLPLPKIANKSNNWSLQNINPLFRYIKYTENQSLITHYDDTYQYNEFKKTLFTVVIYLDDSNAQTRFLNDINSFVSEDDKNYDDWNRLANDNEVSLSFSAKAGDILIFEHRVLHDATPPLTHKTILRTDIICEAPFFGFDL
jgi:NAD+ synthetase